MRNFFRSPLFRCLVCLILVCCVLVNMSPIRADAFAGGAALTALVGSAAAVAVVASAIHALGVMPDSTDTSVFEGVVNDCVSALTASGVFLNGMVTVLQLSDGVHVKNHVNEGIIQAILDWLFSSETVVSLDSSLNFNGLLFPTIDLYNNPNYPYQLIFSQNGQYYFYASLQEPSWVSSGSNLAYFNGQCYDGGWKFSTFSSGSSNWSSTKTTSFNASSIYWNLTSNSFMNGCEIVWANFDFYNYVGDLVVPASDAISVGVTTGLVAGQIGADIKTDYETWVEEGVVAVDFGIGYVDDPNTHNDDDEDGDDDTGTEIGPTVPPGELDPPSPDTQVAPSPSPSPWWKNNKWLNIGGGIVGWELGKVTRYLLDQTQTDVQTGTADPQYKPDTSLFGNGGNGNNTVVDPDPPTSDPSDPTTPSDPSVPSDIAGYTFDLKKIFPFCIPFDLYDFLTCLDATPVAPVINWELHLPGGSTYPLTVDLSAFDSVAQLLRRLELLVFSIALAIKTRDLIKG